MAETKIWEEEILEWEAEILTWEVEILDRVDPLEVVPDKTLVVKVDKSDLKEILANNK